MYLRLRSAFGGGRLDWIRAFCLLAGALSPFISRMGFFGDGRVSEIAFALAFTWVAVVGLTCQWLLAADLLACGARLWDFAGGFFFPKTRISPYLTPFRRVSVALALSALTVCWSFVEAGNIRRTDIVLPTAKLPPHINTLRIVHISDIHLGGLYTRGRLERVISLTREAQPDLVAVTGDLVDADMKRWRQEADLIADAVSRAKYGAFAVTGNHEFYQGVDQSLDFMHRAGLTPLRDAVLDIHDAGVAVVGLDDPAKYGRALTDTEHMPEGLVFPEDRFVLLLKHRPRVAEWSRGRFDLQLSGHTHGGQIWPFGFLARRVNGAVQGLTLINNGDDTESAVYVTNGAGFWGPPLRFLTPPEIVIIDLIRP